VEKIDAQARGMFDSGVEFVTDFLQGYQKAKYFQRTERDSHDAGHASV